jgi:hypothetical protein
MSKATAKMGFCGDICDHCPRYRATLSSNRAELERVAILWHKAGSGPKVLPPEEMICHGCSPEKKCPFGFAQCASGKGLSNCGECILYPCPNLQARFDMIPSLSQQWKQVCTDQEYELVHKAFWQKKENLDKARVKLKR